MKRLVICTGIVLLAIGCATAGTWTTLDYSGVSNNTTYVYGIDGSNIVGSYLSSGNPWRGFLYNENGWTTLNKPGASATYIQAVNGSNAVGYYSTGSFTGGMIYNVTTQSWTDLPMPAYGIDGSNVLISGGAGSAMVYNIITQSSTPCNVPMGSSVRGISGSNVVGWYNDMSGNSHGFISDGTNWTTLDKPEFSGTRIWDIEGDKLVGRYKDAFGAEHGFLYNLTTQDWIPIDKPGAQETWVYDISGNNLVGGYYDSTGLHGFVYTIPEPATICLLALGGMFLRKRRS